MIKLWFVKPASTEGQGAAGITIFSVLPALSPYSVSLALSAGKKTNKQAKKTLTT